MKLISIPSEDQIRQGLEQTFGQQKPTKPPDDRVPPNDQIGQGLERIFGQPKPVATTSDEAPPDAQRFSELEGIIERGLKNFIEVGNALLEIRDSRLYRKTHSTFEEYCRERWQISNRHANRLIEAAEIATNLGPIGPIPTYESQVRPLASLEPDQQREVWKEAVEKSSSGKPTAAQVAEAARNVLEGEVIAPVPSWERATTPETPVENPDLERDPKPPGQLAPRPVPEGVIALPLPPALQSDIERNRAVIAAFYSRVREVLYPLIIDLHNDVKSHDANDVGLWNFIIEHLHEDFVLLEHKKHRDAFRREREEQRIR